MYSLDMADQNLIDYGKRELNKRFKNQLSYPVGLSRDKTSIIFAYEPPDKDIRYFRVNYDSISEFNDKDLADRNIR